jgi:serine/threonine protein kinase
MSNAFEDAFEMDSEDWTTREEVIRRFEAAWQRGPRPSVEDYLPPDEPLRRSILIELVLTDLEFRLKNGEDARAEQYLDRFDVLRSKPGVELELITAELDLRRRREPGLAIDGFLTRFPQYDMDLKRISMGLPQSGTTMRLRLNCSQCHQPLAFPPDGTSDVLICSSCKALDPVEQAPQQVGPPVHGRLGKYDLLEELGRGAYGIVYRARDGELDRIVALKILQTVRRFSPGATDRFLREARNAAQLNHPHIVPIHDFGREGETYYLVCAFVPGTTLARHMADGRLPSDEAALLVARVAEALHYAHLQGVVHRDVKPANILLDNQGEPHLTDFGLARREADMVTMTLDGEILGTPAYMSPEQARGEGHRVDGRADVYSLGVVLYQMLTGQLPFWGENGHIVLKRLLHEEPRAPRRLYAAIPGDLETICLKCLEKNADRRYPDAGALAADVRLFLDDRPIRATPIRRVEYVARWCRRRPAVASLSLAVILVAVAGLAFSARQIRQSRASDERARESTSKSERLLRGSVMLLQGKLTKAKNQHHSLSFMRADERDDLLRDITELRMLLEDESQKPYGTLRLRALYVLGWGFSLTESSEKGKEALTDAIALAEKLGSSDSHDQELPVELASCHNLLANLIYRAGLPAEAEPHYQHAIRLCNDVIERQPMLPASRASLGEALIDQATNARARGLDREARLLYLKAQGIFKELQAEFPQESRYLRDEAAALTNLGELELKEKKAVLARSHCEVAVRLYVRLGPYPGSPPPIVLERAKGFRVLSRAERLLGCFDAAVRSAQAAVDDLRPVVKDFPVALVHADLAAAYENLGTTYGRAGRLNDALVAYQNAALEIDEALRLSPNDTQYHHFRGGIKHNQALTEKRIRDGDGKAREVRPRAGQPDKAALVPRPSSTIDRA